MKLRNKALIALGALAIVGGAIWLAQPPASVEAADHNDPPDRGPTDPIADIADLYAWHTDGGDLVAILTFAGNAAPGVDTEYDRDVLYGIHIDSDGEIENGAEEDLWFRFAQDGDGNWGVQVTGFPGSTEPVEGAVADGAMTVGGGQVQVGLFDDPFFFDLEGFIATSTSGTLSFDGTRDSFAGNNAKAIVVRVPLTEIEGTNLRVWATTARIGG